MFINFVLVSTTNLRKLSKNFCYVGVPSPSTCAGVDQKFRVADPHRFNADTDPDPVFFLTADPDSGSGSRSRIRIRV
jgi:hypothetical protein